MLHAAHLPLVEVKSCLSKLNHSLPHLQTAYGLQHSREKQENQVNEHELLELTRIYNGTFYVDDELLLLEAS